jgi:hypothetical protein
MTLFHKIYRLLLAIIGRLPTHRFRTIWNKFIEGNSSLRHGLLERNSDELLAILFEELKALRHPRKWSR